MSEYLIRDTDYLSGRVGFWIKRACKLMDYSQRSRNAMKAAKAMDAAYVAFAKAEPKK